MTSNRKGWGRVFGQPAATFGLPNYAYNSICVIVGSLLLTDTWAQSIGLILVLEAFLVSIERCWPEEERPQ